LRAFGYIRVSSEEQVKNYSLQNQQQAIESFCFERNIELLEIYREEGESAKTANRTQLNRLLSDCNSNSGNVELVIVHNFDRFARNAYDHVRIKMELKKVNIRLLSIQQPLEDDPSGRMLEHIYAAVAQHDNEMRALRVTDGMRKGLSEGRWMWAAPFGYKRGLAKSSPSLYQVEDEAQWVKLAFEQVALGKSKAEVLRELTKCGCLNRKGKQFTKQSLSGILNNPLYSGRIVKMGIDALGDFDPIVSEELFNKVNMLQSKQRGIRHSRLHSDFPLRRFIHCSGCGGSLTGSWSTGRSGKKYAHYRCENAKCRSVKLKKDKLDSLFIEHLSQLSIKPQVFDLFEAITRDVWKERTSENRAAAVKLEQRIADLKHRRDRLVDAYIQDGKIDKETYEGRISSIKNELSELQSLVPKKALSSERLEHIIVNTKAMLTDLPRTWNRLQIEQKVAFQRLIYPDGICCDGNKIGTPKKSWLLIDFMDENSKENGVVRPTISDWNRFEEWINGVTRMEMTMNLNN
jgi:site-specific DNA recombinase